MQKPLAIFPLLAVLAACSSAPPTTDAPVAATSSDSARAQPTESRRAAVAARPSPSGLEDPARLAMRNIYFPYDNFSVDAKYEQMLSAHASYLAHNPASHVSLEGNTDERGSSEYNLALGQKRAEAVRNSLKLRGVSDIQMEAISYGKEKPKAVCHDESCWRENRRTDIAYPAKP